jgi:chemotaxis protein methyltransferase CheR
MQGPSLSRQEFGDLQRLIYGEAGIYLSEAKQALMAGRLGRRVRALGLPSYADYCQLARRDAQERQRLLEAICTHETRFFREPRQFELLEKVIVPEWRRLAAGGQRSRHVRVWSAACSSGEEPFSLAMVLLDHLPAAHGWAVEVLATDLSTRVLAQAREARWPVARAAEIPATYLRRYMLRGTRSQEGFMRAGPALRDAVRFASLNLHDDTYGVGRFDLVLCRNVLIYFDRAAKAHVLTRLASHLEPGGHLFLGHAETLSASDAGLRLVAPTVYRRAA